MLIIQLLFRAISLHWFLLNVLLGVRRDLFEYGSIAGSLALAKPTATRRPSSLLCALLSNRLNILDEG